MTGPYFPSGDPRAERNAAMAETMAYLGDFPAAVEALQDALAQAPRWAAGWCKLGDYFEELGQLDAAQDAWAEAVRADPSDPFGAGLKRDLARQVPVTDGMPVAFVEMLFDQYSGHFEESLLGKLDYGAPRQVAQALGQLERQHFERVLDLGCGTGLVGTAIRRHCGWLEGVDLSAGMLEQAADKQCYDRLEKGDITRLPLPDQPFDLITAADVFNYIGKLDALLVWCATALARDGALIFTVERGDGPCSLHQARRFAHGRPYVDDVLGRAGFGWSLIKDCVLRQENDAPVHGLTITARFTPPGAGTRPN